MNESRRFLSTAIASALDFEVMNPDDVIRHVTMDVLAHHLPESLKMRLLTAALEAEVMNAMLVLDTLGVDALAEHVPANLLWNCVAEAAVRSLGQSTAPESAPVSALVSAAADPVASKPAAVVPAPKASAPEAVEPLPATPSVGTAATEALPKARKPNRSARASRVRAGATSRSATLPPPQAPTPIPEEEDSAFDVDTRVGADPSLTGLDSLDDNSYPDSSDDVTSHGQK